MIDLLEDGLSYSIETGQVSTPGIHRGRGVDGKDDTGILSGHQFYFLTFLIGNFFLRRGSFNQISDLRALWNLLVIYVDFIPGVTELTVPNLLIAIF